MRIYIDSADIGEIREALDMGFVHGVTTNPTILKRAGLRASEVPRLVAQATEAGARELHAQVYSESTEDMIREGRQLAELDAQRIVIKIPATAAGYTAAAHLAARGLRVTLTAVYTVRQAVLAQSAGAHYVAVYLGRMRDQGVDALELVARMQHALDVQKSRVEILAASVRDPLEVDALAELGVTTVTLPLKVLSQLVVSPATRAAADVFLEDARAIRDPDPAGT